MKKNIILLLLILQIAIFTSCDKIDNPDVITIDTITKVPEFPVAVNMKRKVLIEDFTGHTCVNCPYAHDIIEDLVSQYGDALIPIAVHVGTFAEPELPEFPEDFRTEAGNELNDFFDCSSLGLPNGMINRHSFNGNLILYRTQWASSLAQIITLPQEANIQIINQQDTATGKFFTHVKTSFLTELNTKLNLCVFVVEDSIIAPQKHTEFGTIEDYEHRHMLRGSLNGAWGTTIAENGALANSSVVKSYSILLQNTWKAKHCAIIAFVYNTETKEILQAETLKLMGN